MLDCDLVAPRLSGGDGLGHAARFQGDDADAVRPELARPLPAQTLDGVEGDLEASQTGERLRAVPAEMPGSLPDPRLTMCRAAARVVKNCVRIAVVIG